ncbi:AraC family transcriptional regulator [Paenibacillus endoradicis]|uniref:AraC family transcriptional regulator n=1 Tax=Paenibacillus endoradicis TaxID=2972487 RepID=UPI0021592277|nr:helix-turn-helix transcriptional regulator [Paenibacillus endoradicis]MCR8657869.1 AraC family transcriptional regulator [Paenibacillus endoradicis]
MLDDENLRHVFSTVERSLPLFIETIGYSAWERVFHRPAGYHHYHWLHTIVGEGKIEQLGEITALSAGMGVLLPPFSPHTYYPTSDRWSTIYITFGGASVSSVMDALEMNKSIIYKESEEGLFGPLFVDIITNIGLDGELSAMEASTELYRFLIHLRKFSRQHDQPSLSQFYEKLAPIVSWMELNLNKNIGLSEIAQYAGIGVSSLHEQFQTAFGVSPYSFLIQLRIRETKRILVNQPQLALKDVAIHTGFNDVSHFVATFRRKEGITPGKYRELYHSQETVD